MVDPTARSKSSRTSNALWGDKIGWARLARARATRGAQREVRGGAGAASGGVVGRRSDWAVERRGRPCGAAREGEAGGGGRRRAARPRRAARVGGHFCSAFFFGVRGTASRCSSCARGSGRRTPSAAAAVAAAAAAWRLAGCVAFGASLSRTRDGVRRRARGGGGARARARARARALPHSAGKCTGETRGDRQRCAGGGAIGHVRALLGHPCECRALGRAHCVNRCRAAAPKYRSLLSWAGPPALLCVGSLRSLAEPMRAPGRTPSHSRLGAAVALVPCVQQRR